VLWLRTERVTQPFGIFGSWPSRWKPCKADDNSFNHIPLPRSTFKVKVDEPQQDVPSPRANAAKQTLPENPPRLDAPFFPLMTLLTPTNDKSLPTTPAQGSINVSVNPKSVDGHTNTRIGEMETVIEEGGMDNTEVLPDRHYKRKFRFGSGKGMPGMVPLMP
jgi:hypothetical protein